MLSVELYEQADGFDRLAVEWRDLVDSAQGGVFLHPTWQRLWWRHLAGDAQLQLYAFREGTTLVGLAPLMRLASGELQVVGGVDVADYLDVLYLPGRSCDVFGKLLDTLAARSDWTSLSLQDVPEQSLTRHCLVNAAGERGIAALEEVEEVCPRIKLPGSFDEYLETLTSDDRHELRRKMRKASNRRGYRFTALEATTDLAGSIEEFVTLHVKSSGDKATFMTEPMRRFFTDLAAHGEELGVVLNFIEIGGRRVAGLLNYRSNGELWSYNSGHDPEYNQFSVGVAIFGFTIEWAIQQGLRVFDFLRGNEPYKYDFGSVDTTVHRIRLEHP